MADGILPNNIEPLFKVVTINESHTPNSTYTSSTVTYPEVDGYEPVGIAGYSFPRAASMVYRARNDGDTAFFQLHNYSTSSTAFTFMVKVLYVRNFG